MRTRVFVYASLVLLAALPSSALAVVTVSTTTIQAPAGDLVAGATVSVVCQAEGNTVSGMLGSTTTTIDRIDVTVTDGTVTPATITGAVSQTCSSGTGTCSVLSGTVSWATSSTPGTLTATCTIAYTNKPLFGSGTPGTVSSSASVTTIAGAAFPPVVGAIDGPGQAIVGTSSAYTVTASDPNNPPGPLTYVWSATGGTITPDPANPAAASWQAPATPGSYDVVVAVSSGTASVEARTTVAVVLATYQAGLPISMRVPYRLAASDGGALYAVDARQYEIGEVLYVTPRGETLGLVSLPEPALAVAYGAGVLWVTTSAGNVFKIDPSTGRLLGQLALSDGPFAMPQGIAYDPTHMALWIADPTAGRVRVIGLDGTTIANLADAGGGTLSGVHDVAIDAAHGRAWVLAFTAKNTLDVDPVTGAVIEPIADARFLHAFDLDGHYLDSFVTYGIGTGQLTRTGGIAVSPSGRVYVSDAYQGTIQVYDSAGTFVGTVGAWGSAVGQLLSPAGLAFMKNGDLLVANSSQSRVDRFGVGTPLPTCAGDTDCDGLSDAWEIAHNLNPNWAGDALVDYDGDGLNNREEYAYRTNPRSADTDGDGYSDRDELLAGFDPTNPYDHTPVAVSASGPAQTPPGLVRLSAVAVGPGTCGVTWTQTSGPPVTLRAGNTPAASFVARAAATYEFKAIALCSSQSSAPAYVHVEVLNVAPLADAGRVVVASTGAPVRLNAGFSSDANADPLTFHWEQTLGPVTSVTAQGGALTMHPRRAGLYAFQLTAADGTLSGTAEVPVLIASGSVPTAIAAAFPADPEVDSTVVLDAGASLVDTDTPTFSWNQVAGPPVELAGANEAVASFVPATPGRYGFEVTVTGAVLRAPAARVEVFVAGTNGLPLVSASTPASVVAANAPVSLEASASGSGLGFEWKQVAGPAAGLTDADRSTATAVPFAPGFYVFEVSALDGDAVSRPARVAFEARANGNAIPVALIAVPGLAPMSGQLVFLDGRQSSGGNHFRWTQVAGPWVVLGTQNAVTSFRPPVPGVYAFELEVDDGTVRSAPARVEINVSEQGVQ